ncbi:MAG: hypothetical protein JXQ80_02800 [Bacteroidales bacterium]|nr:hypothetical protein [Bacteroidales bacterium]
MYLCNKCGIELDEGMTVCPLCNTPVNTKVVSGNQPVNELVAGSNDSFITGLEKLTSVQKRKLFWELSGIIIFSGILMTLIINLVISGKITWSRYPVTACLVVFANITLLSFWRHRLVLFLAGSFFSTASLLVLMDFYNNKAGWGTQLGVPLLLALYVLIWLLALLARGTTKQGLNILGNSFVAIGIYTMCTEGIATRYVNGEMTFSWSLIVMASMIPIAGILYFFHYRLNKGIELRRFFHI